MTVGVTDPGTFRQGDASDAYTVTVTNSGTGPTVGTVTVTDTLPNGLTPTGDNGTFNGWTVTSNGQTVTATRSNVLASGASYPSLTVNVAVSANAAATLTNTVTVAGGGEVVTSNDSASDPTPITQVADMTIGVTDPGTFKQGDADDPYTITVTNSGPGPTVGTVTVVDALPTGLTPTGDTGTFNGWSLSTNGQTVTATRSDVLSSGHSYPALTVAVAVSNDAAASVTNTVSVSGGGELNTSNDTASDPTPITQVADMTIGLTDPGNFAQGDASDPYTITVTNSGPGPTVGTVTVTDTLPSALTPTGDNGTFNGWSVSTNGQTVTATRSDALASGASYPALTVNVAVSDTAAATVTNTVNVAGGGEINTGNDSASDQTPITQLADMTIGVTDPGTFTQGDASDAYTITVTNSGNGPSSGTVTVTDTLPTGLTPTGDNGTFNGWAVSTNGQTVTATRSDVLASGATYQVLPITVAVSANAPATLTNNVSVAGGGEVITGNDSASDPTPITQVADLTIGVTDPGNFKQRDTSDAYTIIVGNTGPGPTRGTVTVVDTLPTGLTPTGDNGTINGWAVSTNGQTVTATRSDVLASGVSYPALTVTVAVSNDAAATLTNSVAVSGGGEINTSNDSASDATTIAPVTEVSFAPVADNTLYQSTNPSHQLSDGAGPHFFVGATNQPAGSNLRRGVLKFDLSSVPAGSEITSVNLTLHLDINASPTAETVDLSRLLQDWGEGTSNASGGNEGQGIAATTNDATWLDSFYSAANPTHWTTAGGTFASTASATASVGTTAGFDSWTGDGLIADVVQWLSQPSTNFGWIVTGDESQSGTAMEFDSRESTTTSFQPSLTIDYTPSPVNLTVAMSHSGSFTQGDASQPYTITVTNAGTAPTSGTVTVTDTLPVGLTPTGHSGTIDGWTVSTSGQTVTATRADVLASGASYPPLTLTVAVADTAPASVTNTVYVSGGGEVNTASGSASDPTTITQLADLTVGVADPGNFTQGDASDTYTITVSNAGHGPTAGTVTVTDVLPAGLTPTGDTGTSNGWAFSTSGQTVTATRSDVLASGASYPSLTVTVAVSDFAPASVANPVTVAGGGEIITDNDSASDSTSIAAMPASALTITTPFPVVVGAPFSLTVDAVDAIGRVTPAYQGSVTLSLTNGPAGSTLGGTLTESVNNGIATFTGLTLNAVGGGYTIQAISGTLTSIATNSFSVFAPTTAAVGTRFRAVVNGSTSGNTSATQVAGGGILNGDTGVFTQTTFDRGTGNYTGTLVETTPDGASTISAQITGNQNASNLTESLTVTGGTGVFAGVTGSGADHGASNNGVVQFTSSGTLYVGGPVTDVYNPAAWDDQITGNVTDNGAGVQGVGVSLRDSATGLFWDGSGFAAGAEMFLPATVSADGTWSLAVPHTALTDGATYVVHSEAIDSVGNVQPTPGQAAFIYDVTAPAPASSLALAAGSDSGVVGDNLTNDATPTLTGVAEPNSSVQLIDDGTFLGQVVADNSGNWSFTIGGAGSDAPSLAIGAHRITATATDAAGNVSAASKALTVIIGTETTPPTIDAINPAQGGIAGGMAITITGSDLGTAVTTLVSFGGTSATIVSDDGSTLVVTSPQGSALGTVNVTVTTAGGASAASQASQFTYVTSTPQITWNNPAGIRYGTVLGAAQLDATASVPGTFTYTLADGTTPAGGALLHAGANQVLNVAFTPTDTTDYTSASAQVTINVNARVLTATVVGNPTKVYDGTTSVTLTPGNFQLTSLVGGDSLTVTQTAGTYDRKDTNATTITATLTAGDFSAGAGTLTSDYVLPTIASGAGTISARTLTVAIIGTPTRTYDGTISAALVPANYQLTGLLDGESVTINQTAGVFDSKDTSATTVSVSLASGNFVAGNGTSISDYLLPTSASGAGSIAAKALTAAIVGTPTKTYDGTTVATLTPTNFQLTGLVAGESFTVTQTTGTYDSPDTNASSITATLAANQFSPAVGTSINDYALPATASGPGAITAASQSISFTPSGAIAYGATLALTATGGGSGNAVTFSVISGPGTLSGNTLSTTGIGVIVLEADQAGNLDYTAAPAVQHNIVVAATFANGTIAENENGTPTAITVFSLLGSHYGDPEGVFTKPGIAVFQTAGDGTWQYSTNKKGAPWTPLGNQSQSQALLLPGSDSLRFVPATNSTGSASLFFVAWDGSQGTAGKLTSIATSGGTTPFSVNAGTLTVNVNPVPRWVGAGATLTSVVPGTSPAGDTISSVFVSYFQDNNPAVSVGVAVVGVTGASSGTWQFSTNSGAAWTNVPAVSAKAALLLSAGDMIRFVPKSAFAGTVALKALAWDGSAGTDGALGNPATLASSAFSTAALTATFSANRAPTLARAAISVPSVAQYATSGAVTVGSLLTASQAGFTDPDGKSVPQGIAIVDTLSTLGTYQYMLAGKTWQPLPNVAPSAALLLPTTASLRFIAGGQLGTATLTFLAWDQTQGLAGQMFDIASTGGATAFSTTSTVASITISTSTNHAPSLGTPAVTLVPAVAVNTTGPAITVATILTQAGYADADGSKLPQGIAVVSAAAAGGVEQYMLKGGTWQPLPTVSSASALLLPSSASVRLVAGSQIGTASLTFYGWDQTQGAAGQLFPIVNAGAAAFSATTTSASIAVGAAPSWSAAAGAALTPLAPGSYSTASNTSPPGNTIAAVFGAFFRDATVGLNVGVAIAAVSGNGTWQFSVDGGSTWLGFTPAPAKASATLLVASDLIRFVPTSSKASVGTMTAYAWDGTGNFTSTADLTKTGIGGATPFSATMLTALSAFNKAPTLIPPRNAIALAPINENVTSPALTAAALLGKAAYLDPDGKSALSGIAITADSGQGTWQWKIGGKFAALPSVPAGSAFLLPSSAQVIFQPANNLRPNTNNAATLTYLAWDQTAGVTRTLFPLPAQGGASAFSIASAIVSMPVNFVKQAPTWLPGSTAVFTPVLGFSPTSNPNPDGDTVAAVFGSAFHDSAGAPVGVAIPVQAAASVGAWQYSTDGGTTWQPVPSAPAGTAVLLHASDRLRFVPAKLFSGVVALTAYAWDGSGGFSGGVANLTQTGIGAATPFSAKTLTATCLVNSAPTLS
jgi:uncharacterized repeat protein (TIGR01451 family)